MEYLIRFIQIHESFRQPETDALAELLGLNLQWITYSETVCLHRLKGGEG
jgi:tRNA (guanine10-N2)-methyltransferase